MNVTNHLVQKYHHNLPLETLIENCRIYHSDNAELNIYETFEPAKAICLKFSEPVLGSMLQGKKIMHLENAPSFDFGPKQSILLPSDSLMKIDFPEANLKQPTRCLALRINPELISKTLQTMNEYSSCYSKNDEWKISSDNFFLPQDTNIDYNIHRLVQLFLEQHVDQSAFVNLSLQELIIRLLRTQAKNSLIKASQKPQTNHRLSVLAIYIEQNLQEDISVSDLCKKAHMSKPNLFRYFKNEFGLTPVEYINQRRIHKAKEILRNPLKSVSDACYEVGYNSLSYFNKVFKKMTGTTPKQYKKQ